MGFGKDGDGAIIYENVQIALSTLADSAAIKQTSGGVGSSLEEDFRVFKTEYDIHIEGGADEDFVTIGICDNELSVTEIAETLNLNGPVDRNDRDSVEKSERAVFEFGHKRGAGDDGEKFVPRMSHSWGKGWTFSDTDGWAWFAYNDSGAALPTGTIIRIRAKHFGKWLT